MHILFIGDIVGSPGRHIVKERLADTVAQQRIDLVIANCENAASGFGITPRLTEELFATGIDVLSGGNHIFDRREILDYFAHAPRLLRPANFPAGTPGSGLYIGETKNGVAYAVLNLQGRTFMAPIDCPFRAADEQLAKIPAHVKFVLVDFHAETTSEKIALGWYLDGKVSALVGTHTHVVTADERILPRGTAYISDVGMTGPHDGVIGMERSAIIAKFLDALPRRFEVAEGNIQMNCVLIEADENASTAAPSSIAAADSAASPSGSHVPRAPAKSISRLRLRID